MRTKFGLVMAIAFALALPAATMAQSSTDQAQVPQPAQGGVNWQGVGVGAGTLASNVVYIPAKLVYGILGGIAGGAGYAVTGGNTQVANTIWRSSLGGDYVVTPDMLTGKQPIHFSGPTTVEPPASAAGTSSAGPTSSASSANGTMARASSTSAAPMDNGTGPVGGGSNSSNISSTSIDSSGSGTISSAPASSYNSAAPVAKSASSKKPAVDTSIE
jgi:hypothetical protein